jgi:hypothetical protein
MLIRDLLQEMIARGFTMMERHRVFVLFWRLAPCRIAATGARKPRESGLNGLFTKQGSHETGVTQKQGSSLELDSCNP